MRALWLVDSLIFFWFGELKIFENSRQFLFIHSFNINVAHIVHKSLKTNTVNNKIAEKEKRKQLNII